MKTKWCIALENIGPYIDSVLGPRYMFLKGERATKEKVFNMIPDMTEEEYAKFFRPATEEEINGEFEWNGLQYILKKTKRMKSIKEKAIEFAKENINSLGFISQEHIDGYVAGANYVLGEIENFIKDSDLGNSAEEKFYKLDILADIHEFIEQLKK